MIPKYIMFGYSVNSWVWMIVIVLIIINKNIIHDSVMEINPFLIENSWIIYLLFIAITIDLILGCILMFIYLGKNNDSEKE